MPAGGLSPPGQGPLVTSASLCRRNHRVHSHPRSFLPRASSSAPHAVSAGPRRPPGLTGLGTATVYCCAAPHAPPTCSGLGAEPPIAGRVLGGLCSACSSIPAAALGEIQGDVGRGIRRLRQRKHQCFCKCESVGKGRRSPKEAPRQERGTSRRRCCAAGAVPQGRPAAILSSLLR